MSKVVLAFILFLLAALIGSMWYSMSCHEGDRSREGLGVFYKVIHNGRSYETANYTVDDRGTLTFDTWYDCSRCGCLEKDSSLIMPAGTYIIEVRDSE